jgi:DNA-binding CsgD family transcriptional regulator
MLTGAVKEQFEADPRFARYEYSVPDVNKFGYLARRRRPSGALGIATGGMPAQSARFRDLLAPLGIGDELRVSFVVQGQCWGAASLYRDAGAEPFTDDDADRIAELSEVLAEGVRRSLLLRAPQPEAVAGGPGVVLIDDLGAVRSVSPAARRMLADAVDVGAGPRDRLPAAVFAVAARARAVALDGDDGLARVSVPTTTGRWLVLHGTRLAGDEALTAVIVDTARAAELAPIIVSSYRLTEREREVTELVIRGRSTAEVAQRLHLSPLTVQDHLKSVFAKTGVRTRRELVARIFVDHYEPRLRAGDTPTATGFFARD